MAMFFAMFVIFAAMLVTLVLAGLVVAYVAYIQQGRDIPHAVPRAAWLTDALRRFADRWHTLIEGPEQREDERDLHIRRGGISRTSDR